MVVSILVIYPCDLRLTRSCSRMLPLSSTVREVRKRSKFQVPSTVSTECIFFSHHHNIKQSKHDKWNMVCILHYFSEVIFKSKLHGQKLGKNINMLLSLLFSFTVRLFYILIHTTVQDV